MSFVLLLKAIYVLPCMYETGELLCSRISERVNISLRVWLRIPLCSAACKQLLRLPSYWSEFTSGFGSVKYLRAPKTPALTHTCILGLRNQNLPRVLFLLQKSHTLPQNRKHETQDVCGPNKVVHTITTTGRSSLSRAL